MCVDCVCCDWFVARESFGFCGDFWFVGSSCVGFVGTLFPIVGVGLCMVEVCIFVDIDGFVCALVGFVCDAVERVLRAVLLLFYFCYVLCLLGILCFYYG